MYKIPSDFNIQTIEGERIEQIAFGSNFITFFFGSGYIQTTGCFDYIFSGETFEYMEIYPLTTDLGLLKLLDKVVVKVCRNETDVMIEFENNNKVIFKAIDNYETYRMSLDGREVVI